jgi:hypothetical protein
MLAALGSSPCTRELYVKASFLQPYTCTQQTVFKVLCGCRGSLLARYSPVYVCTSTELPAFQSGMGLRHLLVPWNILRDKSGDPYGPFLAARPVRLSFGYLSILQSILSTFRFSCSSHYSTELPSLLFYLLLPCKSWGVKEPAFII